MIPGNIDRRVTIGSFVGLALVASLCQLCFGQNDPAASVDAAQLLRDSGVRGGLVVHVGCGNGRRTAALHASESYLVHGLDADPAHVAAARDYIHSQGLDGKVSVERWEGDKLPYIDNLVRLLIAEDLGHVDRDEVLRVLCPSGVAFVKVGESWQKIVKRWPDDIDEWTHYLHDPSNNAVAQDTVVGPPRRIQWLGGPRWTRDHGSLNSISSVVTAGGRIYFILDETTGSTMNLPGRWVIVARDAFNGVELWRLAMESWAPHTISFRSGPPQLPRLLVASRDHVYAPLGWNEPVSQIDSQTGKVLTTYKSSCGAREMVLWGKRLLVLRNTSALQPAANGSTTTGKNRQSPTQSIVAIDTESGQTIWEVADLGGQPMPETLATDGENVCIQIDGKVLCLSLASGAQRWTFETEEKRETRRKFAPGFGTHVLVMSDHVVLCELSGEVVALSIRDGKKLWSCAGGQGFHAPLDLFVIDGIVWTGNHPLDSGPPHFSSPPPVDDFSVGRDLHTGKVKFRNSVMVDLQSTGHHHRCYRNKASLRYIMTGKRGIEMFEIAGDNHSRNNWVRGTCQYGIMPANGLIYAPPHSCSCYPESMMRGFLALAPEYSAKQHASAASRQSNSSRLQKGPAYGTVPSTPYQPNPADWPMFRHDARRTGVAPTEVPAKITKCWEVAIGGRLSQPVIAQGKVVVAAVDHHRVHALDKRTGNTLWSHTVGGRVDSPPAIYKGLVLFGSADGWVYCLRLTDGELVWRFLAAPTDLRTVSWNQLESVWPVHGSVLILNDTVYFSAGRSTWLDQGIDLYGLDPATGKLLHHDHYESEQPKFRQGKDESGTVRERVAAFNERVARQHARGSNRADYKSFLQPDRSVSFSMAGGTVSDILVSDGTNVFLHQVKFNSELQLQDDMSRHLFSTSGFLDDAAEESRTHWMLGKGDFSMLPFPYSVALRHHCDVQPVFGMGLAYDGQMAWSLLRRRPYSKDAVIRVTGKVLGGEGDASPADWQVMIGELRPKSILKAGNHLWIGGKANRRGVLHVLSASNGQMIHTQTFAVPMVWDGMAAAGRCLYLSLESGAIACFGAEDNVE